MAEMGDDLEIRDIGRLSAFFIAVLGAIIKNIMFLLWLVCLSVGL